MLTYIIRKIIPFLILHFRLILIVCVVSIFQLTYYVINNISLIRLISFLKKNKDSLKNDLKVHGLSAVSWAFHNGHVKNLNGEIEM